MIETARKEVKVMPFDMKFVTKCAIAQVGLCALVMWATKLIGGTSMSVPTVLLNMEDKGENKMTVRQLLDMNELLCEILIKKQTDYDMYKDNGDGYSDYLKIGMADAEKKYNEFLEMEVTIK